MLHASTLPDIGSEPQSVSLPPPQVVGETLKAVVHSIVPVTQDVVSIEFRPSDAHIAFPAFSAGAHIDLHLPNGLIRSYSLHNSQDDTSRYKIGVLRDRSSRGGSSWIHRELRHGDTLTISKPRNNFALFEDAPRSVFVSGGIGVTPLLSMIRRLSSLGRRSHMLYCARKKNDAPFYRELEQLEGEMLTIQPHFSDENGKIANIESYLSAFTAADHFYCCGPGPMLDAFEAACTSLGFPHVHMERFRAPTVDLASADSDEQCVVELAKSNRKLCVPKGKSLLKSLIEAGVDMPYSCEEGVCGSCETRIISGDVEHRDSVLSKSQKAENRVMMVCVSRCKSDHLVLDL